jgi:general secretion pathway protein I
LQSDGTLSVNAYLKWITDEMPMDCALRAGCYLQRNSTRRAQQDPEAGFTLVEIIVALAILSISLGLLLNVISSGMWRSSQAQNLSEANSLAQSLLARVGADLPIEPTQRVGEFASGFRWRLSIEPYGSSVDREQWPTGAYMVTAQVLWGADQANERSVTLSTLRLGPKPVTR